eukprot:g802.t1
MFGACVLPLLAALLVRASLSYSTLLFISPGQLHGTELRAWSQPLVPYESLANDTKCSNRKHIFLWRFNVKTL